MSLGVALPLAEHLLANCAKWRKLRALRRQVPYGGGKKRISGLDVLVVSKNAPLALGPAKAALIIEGAIQGDVRAVERTCSGPQR